MVVGWIFIILYFSAALLIIAALFLFLISNIISSVRGAPYIPIKRALVKRLLAWGGVSSDDVFYDLGCGDARILMGAIKEFGVKKAIGYEVAPWAYLEAIFSVWLNGAGDNIKIIRQNFFQADLSGGRFVYMYLFPKLVDKLAHKLERELSIGSKILCPSFPINTNQHVQFKLLKSEKIDKITLYLYEKI